MKKILLIIILLILAFPYIRCFFKRSICQSKIKKLCSKKGYKIHKTHIFCFLGNKHSSKCDLYVETANEVYAIKLFGVPRRRSVFIIKENGEYIIRSYIFVFSYSPGCRIPFDSKPKRMPQYNFRYKYKDEWEIKTPHNVLLVNPVSMEFRRRQHHGGDILVGAGEIVNGMEIDSLPRLLEDLESAL